MACDIVGLDVPWLDELVRLESMPGENQSVRISERSMQGGGKVATALVAAARLGRSAGLVAVVSSGARGQFLLDDFIHHGIDVSKVRREEGYSDGFSIVLSDPASQGRRILWKEPLPGTGLTPEDVLAAKELIQSARYLHLCRMGPAEQTAAQLAREAGVKVCFDGDFYSPDLMDQLPLIDLFIGSEEFYQACCNSSSSKESNLRCLAQSGPETVIFTFGGDGLIGLTGGEYFELPAFSVPVIDTVGAGDVFHGAYLAGRCAGMDGIECARYASAVSAIKCTVSGGRAGIPGHETVLEFLHTGRFDPAVLAPRIAYYEQSQKQL